MLRLTAGRLLGTASGQKNLAFTESENLWRAWIGRAGTDGPVLMKDARYSAGSHARSAAEAFEQQLLGRA